MKKIMVLGSRQIHCLNAKYPKQAAFQWWREELRVRDMPRLCYTNYTTALLTDTH